MDEQFVIEILQKLRTKELYEFKVTKDQFMEFRNILIKQEDFKHFRGIAKQGGSVVYRYTDEARS